MHILFNQLSLIDNKPFAQINSRIGRIINRYFADNISSSLKYKNISIPKIENNIINKYKSFLLNFSKLETNPIIKKQLKY